MNLPRENATAAAVTPEAFASLMSRLGPFEAQPEVAVAVSGGADSMAAALLTRNWVRSRAGKLVALVVDHGLRSESAAEASEVAQRLSALEIEAVILRWSGDKPQANLQAAARHARYHLLSEFCRDRGILHLVLGHHREDQAETFLMRLSRGSGLYGLAAMTPLQEQSDHRLLRPLIGFSKAQLIATLEAEKIQWVEDPSNLDPKFTRTKFRELLPQLAEAGITPETLSETTDSLGRARNSIEVAVASTLARAVWLHPAGIAFVKPEVLLSAPKEIALRGLARILVTVSGADYGPRLVRLERLYGEIASGLTSGTTLSGCRLTPWRRQLVVYRENRHIRPVVLEAGQWLHWDGRFDVRLRGGVGNNFSEFSIGPLGREGWTELRSAVDSDRLTVPAFAAEAVPAFRNDQSITAVPHLGYFNEGWIRDMVEICRFRSGNSLTGVAFTVA